MAQNSTITINKKAAESILEELDNLQKSLVSLRKKVLKLLPSKYGSDAWWEKEIKEGLEEVKQGKYTAYENVHSLIRDLHNG